MSTTKQSEKSAKAKPAAKKVRRASDKPAAKGEAADRSDAIAKSWTNKAVAAARSTKNKVKVGGTEYRSTAAAFEALGLPMGTCIAFRMALKETGRKVYETDKGVKHIFTVVK
jgi:hypothetical protein